MAKSKKPNKRELEILDFIQSSIDENKLVLEDHKHTTNKLVAAGKIIELQKISSFILGELEETEEVQETPEEVHVEEASTSSWIKSGTKLI